MQPPKSILESDFRYTPSHQTDISKRFQAIRREQARQQQAQSSQPRKVVALATKGAR